jgi:hypothetical protein
MGISTPPDEAYSRNIAMAPQQRDCLFEQHGSGKLEMDVLAGER